MKESLNVKGLVEGVDYIWHGGCRRDPKDFDPVFKEVLDKAFHKANDELVSYWLYHVDVCVLQTKILKEQGINWRSIYELNPEKYFD